MRSSTVKYSYLWVTLFLFVFSLIGHWYFAWNAYVEEEREHKQEVKVENYLNQVARDTLENWQSEFLQLIWQVAGLSFLYFVGSPQSKEGDDRKEEKLDLILHKLDPKGASKLLAKLDSKYPRK